MYGQIHCVVRELSIEKFGQDIWKTILTESGLDENEHFLVFNHYEDPLTFKLIGAVSKVVDLSMETVLEVFGDYFLTYCLKHGYDKMLKTLGGDIRSFIQNLDSLHSLLALSYKNIVAPSFRCENAEDGSLLLHYYTTRPGLYPIVIGLVKAVGKELYQQKLDIQVEERFKQPIDGGKTQEHTIFRCTFDCDKKTEENPYTTLYVEKFKKSFHLEAKQFCSAFPYHIIFDEKLTIRQCGVMVHKMSHINLQEDVHMTDAFTVIHPKMTLSITNIHVFINSVFLLAVKIPEKCEGKRALVLKGQMIWLDDSRHMIFIGSPRLTSLNELMEMNVFLADIPLYDVTRELVLLNQQRIAEIDVAKRFDETTVALKKTSKALVEEKKKTDLLLYQMLPPKVANQLKNGKQVEAEKFDAVTVLFSDIVTFTNIAAACSPLQIVNMLNKLYQKFDEKTNEHDVYKVETIGNSYLVVGAVPDDNLLFVFRLKLMVETIGDAYMVVGGVPDNTLFHAQQVASFAIDMVNEASTVESPATGKPLQIRVGIHSGPVVAGVVGMKMPRYCLFGDTVNTASRMESHGVPGRIHVSSTTIDYLKASPFQLKRRGDIAVKGKGMMRTYFIVADKGSYLTEPDDEYRDLQILTHLDREDQYVSESRIMKKSKFRNPKSRSCTVL